MSGWEGTTALLLDHGADPRQTCMTGETALHFAVSLNHGEAAEMLLKRCRDLVNEADKVGVLQQSAGNTVFTCPSTHILRNILSWV